MMFGCRCFNWNSLADLLPMEPDTFSLPAPLPKWPQGTKISSLFFFFFLRI